VIVNNSDNRIKSWAVAGAVVVITAAAVYFSRPAYRHFKEEHAVARAQIFFDKGDYRSAWLSAQQAWLINTNDTQACRIMADVSNIVHSPATLDWFQRIVKINPTVENKLSLAWAGLHYQNPPYPLTTQILGDLSKSADGLATFQYASAQLEYKLNHVAGALSHLEAALKLDPTNQIYQFNIAEIQLNSTNPPVAAAARATLKQFCMDTNQAPTALRVLVADRLFHNDPQAARDFSDQLLTTRQATLSDRLQNLVILQRLQSPDLAMQLDSLQKQSATNALMAGAVAAWMRTNGHLADAILWLTNQPASFQAQQPVRGALVDCYLDSGDWKSLRAFLSKDDSWDDMEYLRLALLSRTWNELGESLVADSNWKSAVNQAGDSLGELNDLLKLANRWGMKPEEEDLLWHIVQKFPDNRWAAEELAILDVSSGNTAGLQQLYSKLLLDSPNDVSDQNNLAFTSLLLKTNLNQAFKLAEAAYNQKPDSATASTYAYALYLQNRTQDGLVVLQKLSNSELETPSVALYYGVLLSAAGETNEAAHFLASAATDGQLLPEERKLLQQAGAGK
jgi:predicted Zn-dependent protease